MLGLSLALEVYCREVTSHEYQYGGKGTCLARKLSMCLSEQCHLTTRKSVNHLGLPQGGLTFQFHYFLADFRWALSGIQSIRSNPKI